MNTSLKNSEKKAAIIIPARYNSSRLNGKPLLEVNGKTIIQYVYERAIMVKNAQAVIVATDDERIYKKCVEFGANVEMTDINHKSGSDRIGEVAKRHFEDVEKIIDTLKNNKDIQMVTLAREIFDKYEINNPNVVKCVFDKNNNAIYFSRSPIPYPRNENNAKYYAHIGIYGYVKESLISMIETQQSMLEKIESLEQLRAFDLGFKIKIIETNKKTLGIDTLDDFNNFKELIKI